VRAGNPVGDVARLVGASDDMGKFMGLDKDWSYRIVKQVGNYGESYERNLGSKSKIKIPRGINNLWSNGGLMYAPPLH
jgi:general L-amino acid transport system substrate-binding protein